MVKLFSSLVIVENFQKCRTYFFIRSIYRIYRKTPSMDFILNPPLLLLTFWLLLSLLSEQHSSILVKSLGTVSVVNSRIRNMKGRNSRAGNGDKLFIIYNSTQYYLNIIKKPTNIILALSLGLAALVS